VCRNSLSESQVTLVRKREEEAGDNAITGYSSSYSLLPSLRCKVVKVINKESFSEHGDGDAQES
jgi:hypothetical protein